MLAPRHVSGTRKRKVLLHSAKQELWSDMRRDTRDCILCEGLSHTDADFAGDEGPILNCWAQGRWSTTRNKSIHDWKANVAKTGSNESHLKILNKKIGCDKGNQWKIIRTRSRQVEIPGNPENWPELTNVKVQEFVVYNTKSYPNNPTQAHNRYTVHVLSVSLNYFWFQLFFEKNEMHGCAFYFRSRSELKTTSY